MKNKIKMAQLEFLTFKSLRTSYLILIPMVIIFMFLDGGKSIIIPAVTSAWIIPLLTQNLFVIQEKNSLERLYSSLSIQIKDVVFGRYLYILITYGIGLIITYLIFSSFSIFQNKPLDFQDILLGFSTSFFLFSLVSGMQLPIFFKMGYMKGKLFATIPYFAIFAFTAIPPLAKVFFTTARYLMSNTGILIVFAFLGGCIIYYLSYSISVIAYRKRR